MLISAELFFHPMIDQTVNFFSLLFHKILGKLGIRIQVSGLRLFLRYCLVGGTATVVDFALLFGLTEFLGLWYLASATAAFIGGATTNYILNRFWTFNNADKRIGRQAGLFIIIAAIGILLNNGILAVGVEIFGLWYMLAKVISSAITLIWNFIGHKYITFRPVNNH